MKKICSTLSILISIIILGSTLGACSQGNLDLINDSHEAPTSKDKISYTNVTVNVSVRNELDLDYVEVWYSDNAVLSEKQEFNIFLKRTAGKVVTTCVTIPAECNKGSNGIESWWAGYENVFFGNSGQNTWDFCYEGEIKYIDS